MGRSEDFQLVFASVRDFDIGDRGSRRREGFGNRRVTAREPAFKMGGAPVRG